MHVEIEREADGRWIADVPSIPGAMVYGATRREALAKVKTLVCRILPKSLREGMTDATGSRTVDLDEALQYPFPGK